MVKVRYVTQCTKHGAESTLWAGKQIATSKPLTKKQRYLGGVSRVPQRSR